MTRTHRQSTIHQESPSADLVNVEEHDGGEDDEKSVLDARSDQVDVPGQVRHLENIHNVLHRVDQQEQGYLGCRTHTYVMTLAPLSGNKKSATAPKALQQSRRPQATHFAATFGK